MKWCILVMVVTLFPLAPVFAGDKVPRYKHDRKKPERSRQLSVVKPRETVVIDQASYRIIRRERKRGG